MQQTSGQSGDQGAGSLVVAFSSGLLRGWQLRREPSARASVQAWPVETHPARSRFLTVPIGPQAIATPPVFFDFRLALTAFQRCACDSRSE